MKMYSLVFVLMVMVVFCAGSAVGEETADAPAATQPADESEGALPPCCPACIGGGDKPSGGEAPATQPTEEVGPVRAGRWMEQDEREAFDLDFAMTDQDGAALKLSDLIGKPIAMSFIYTRCPDPNLCPLITATMARLQEGLDEAGLGERVTLLLLSYDPVFDTPARLKQYGAERGVRFTNAKMLRPDPEMFRELLHEFQIGVDYRSDGTIGHFIELLLIDSEGRYVRDYQGRVWDNAAVMEDLRKLVAEQAAEKTP